ncbi:MAG: T9SS type A sorting domain-containing protein [Saprospiraceae bacterium]|nr:T9SS type A sorting domain-containing protein [Saprospiraceae bacterium]
MALAAFGYATGANIKIDENATVGTNEILNESNVLLFPNPASDLLNVRLSKAPKGRLILSMYNVHGQELLRQRYGQANSMDLNTSGFASGMFPDPSQRRRSVYTKS